ncbi:hypothetical protein [uncultured Thiocystis sp.]|jgi:hypothetical protein|uniref:hypothetical protein n=1 Tax=uncultured Thiocystis sp. TaxID=1202134 RepID=UPI0025F585E7|nr:hypothetical protein [uncultured Thiocystis sp.]
MEESLKQTVYRQREAVARQLHEPLAQLAGECALAWDDRERLNGILIAGLRRIPSCNCLFVIDRDGIQVSDNVTRFGVERGHFGRDRSSRPYMREAVPAWGFLLSDAYVSLVSHRPSLTALHVLRTSEALLGYVGANFDLRHLPMTAGLYDDPAHWLQVKGDPSMISLTFSCDGTHYMPYDEFLSKAVDFWVGSVA